MGDKEHIARTKALVAQAKAHLHGELDRLGLTYLSGQGNFTMIHLPMSDSLAYRKLMTQGVMVRTMTGFRFPNWIRVTMSHPEAMQSHDPGPGQYPALSPKTGRGGNARWRALPARPGISDFIRG